MKTTRIFRIGLTVLPVLIFPGHLGLETAYGAEPVPHIVSAAKPQAGEMQILFHGGTGPFQVQRRLSLDTSAPWLDIPTAKVTEVNTGVFLAVIPTGTEDVAFYRVLSQGEVIAELKGWTISAQVSAPANGTHFVAGESPVVSVAIFDNFAQGVSRDSFSTLSLYMYGPQDPTKTVTASKLLNAVTNRAANPHHYINLKTNPDAQVNGNVLTYPLKPVTDEAPGTYTVSVRAVLGSDAIQQVMRFASVQIGTNAVESPVVAKIKCAACHEGPISGKTYLHHIDPSSTPGSVGSWSLDFEPVKSCKSCHNNDGYAAYRDVAAPGGRVPDPIIRRVHGVHRGEGLKLPFNINPEDGDFRDYTTVMFPADVRNCTKCHLDDRWKTNPSRLACGTCHDNIWFGQAADMPPGWVGHIGGPQANDQFCAFCHSPDTGSFAPVSVVHAISNLTEFAVEMTMTPPANTQYYVAGEAPQVIIKVKDKATGLYVNPTNITESAWNRARLQVSGPRSRTLPVLTTAAADHSRSGSTSYIYNDLRVRTNPANDDPAIVSRTVDSITYQLGTITNLTTGTYTVFVQTQKAGATDVGLINFQVGAATLEPQVATNCTDCHGDTKMHGSYPFSLAPDLCKNCHDYERQLTGKTGWTNSNWGFGAAPIARRVHGVHFGNYLDKPLEIHPTYGKEFGHIIFPQDVRNCTKCHSQSASWTEEPSRLACLACHDSDLAIMHGTLMTYDPTPIDPWSGDEWETCAVCHGKDRDFTPRVVHSISNPYVPPYLRAPRESEPFETASVARGGAMYDKWWAVKGLLTPTTDHPLWATRPDSTSNTRTGSATWQCKECHGWDYKGVAGAYGSGSHRTGIRGIFGTTKTEQEVFDLVKTGHGYGGAGLSDWDIWDLVKFVLQGQIDTGTIIDANRKFIGSTATGQTLYTSGIGSSSSCAVCHGANGLTPPPGHPEFTEYLGLLSNQNPWEFQHKVRFGQPGTAMPSAVAGGGTLQNVADLSAYCQTLPQTP